MSDTGARAKLRAEQAEQRRRERRTLLVVALAIVVLIVAAGVGYTVWRSSLRPSAGPTPAPSATPATLVNGQPVVFGSPSAPVSISLFEDFHCPHCAEFEESYQPVLDQALRSDKASVKIFPLAFVDPGSASAANAFGCAVQAGYGESYFRGLFANHTLEWNDNQLISLLSQVSGADAPASFRTCVTSRQSQGWVDSIAAVATQRSVTSTPTMFLGDERVDIATLTPDALAARIDRGASS